MLKAFFKKNFNKHKNQLFFLIQSASSIHQTLSQGGPQKKSGTKYQISVKQKIRPFLSWINLHGYVFATANYLRQQPNELGKLDVEGRCKRAGRN